MVKTSQGGPLQRGQINRHLNIGDEHGYSLISSDLLQPLHGALDADRLTAQAGQDVTQHVEGGLVVNDEYNTRHLPAASINGRMTPPRGVDHSLRFRQQEILSELGVLALHGTPLRQLLDETARLTASKLSFARFSNIGQQTKGFW
jgi:hypothetical protein